jgi:hypothetical protein
VHDCKFVDQLLAFGGKLKVALTPIGHPLRG